jgi:hypothetical protein
MKFTQLTWSNQVSKDGDVELVYCQLYIGYKWRTGCCGTVKAVDMRMC